MAESYVWYSGFVLHRLPRFLFTILKSIREPQTMALLTEFENELSELRVNTPSLRFNGHVRFTYNEASNVIMTVTGSASHMRGSEFCQRKQLCPGYRPMGLSRNSAY